MESRERCAFVTGLLWTKQASSQLDSIYEYIARDNPSAALVEIEMLMAAVERLVRFPTSGRAGRIASTRELVVPRTPYIIAYRNSETVIQILGIYHGAQRWPRTLPR